MTPVSVNHADPKNVLELILKVNYHETRQFIPYFMRKTYTVIGNGYGRDGDRMFWSLISHLQLTYARDSDHTKT